jgi:putative sigma-54 modulation protein
MQIEMTGRQVTVTRRLRSLAETSLERVGMLLGRSATAHVVLTKEKRRHHAEVTVQAKHHAIVGIAEAVEIEMALKEALEKTEKQAVRLKEKIVGKKKRDGDVKLKLDAAVVDAAPAPVKKTAKTLSKKAIAADANGTASVPKNGAKQNGKVVAVPVTVHSFPVQEVVHQTHIHRSSENVALRPMTIEEAVKEAEFRDRDVFLFRDKKGSVKVLHRKADGRIELIEEP